MNMAATTLYARLPSLSGPTANRLQRIDKASAILCADLRCRHMKTQILCSISKSAVNKMTKIQAMSIWATAGLNEQSVM